MHKESNNYQKSHFGTKDQNSISGNAFSSAVETQHPFPSFVNKSFEELELRKKRLVKMPREIKEIKVRHRKQSLHNNLDNFFREMKVSYSSST